MSEAKARLWSFVERIPVAAWAFVVYLFLSSFFAQERILNTDCSYQLFHSVNNESFFFQESRYGMFITQLPMLLAVHLDLPIAWVTWSYSIGLAATYALLALLAHRVFRCPQAALAIAISLIVGAGDSFFHATTETHLLLALSGFLFAILNQSQESKMTSWWSNVLSIVVTLWCLMTHPNSLFTVSFVVLHTWINGRISAYRVAMLASTILLFAVARYASIPPGSYDENQYKSLLQSLSEPSVIVDSYPIWFICENAGQLYLPVIGLLVSVFVFIRSVRTLLLSITYFVTFCILTIYTFISGSGDAMMVKSFMPSIFMLSIAACHGAYTTPRVQSFAQFSIVIITVGFCHILEHSRRYSDRLTLLRETMEKSIYPKSIVQFEHWKGTALEFNEWATSLDAIFLSQYYWDTPRTVFLQRAEDMDIALRDSSSFVYLPWDSYGANLNNIKYFNLPPVPYQYYPPVYAPSEQGLQTPE